MDRARRNESIRRMRFEDLLARHWRAGFLLDRTESWSGILCLQEERTVGNDHTVKSRSRCLQLPPSRLRCHCVKPVVRVHEYPDGAAADNNDAMRRGAMWMRAGLRHEQTLEFERASRPPSN